MATLQIIDDIDNTNTLYEDVLVPLYGENADVMLTNTKFLRVNILKAIKDFVEAHKVIQVKEFSTNPIMTYADRTKYDYGLPELTTDMVIVPNAKDLATINQAAIDSGNTYPLMIEALNLNNVSKESWNDYLDDIALYYGDGEDTEVHKIVIEDVIPLLKKWEDVTDTPTKEMLKEYNQSQGIENYDYQTFWQEPIDLISKKYWEKFSFVLTINDFEIYDETAEKYLDVIANKYFNEGYFDEIVIKINHFYWFDDFQKIVDWSQKNLRSALVSYRFDTVFSNGTKQRYFDIAEATKYNDTMRTNSMEEDLDMFEFRLPILLEKILTNPQTYGFELESGYFGSEGYIPDLTLGSDKFDDYKEILCKIHNTSPFASLNDSLIKVFRDPDKKIFVCMKNTN